MADSPLLNGSGNIKIVISSEGEAISDEYRLISVTICKKINKIPYAILKFADGDMPNGDFPLSNTDIFKPGKGITIEAGYDQETSSIFEGIVIKHGIEISGANSSMLIVELKDKAVQMTLGRKNANFTDSTDSDVIGTLIGNYSGLTSDIDPTQTTFEQLVQYYATDWDFMMSRAAENGLLVIIDNGKVSVKAPEATADAVLTVTYGFDIMYFKAEVDASEQISSAKSVGWSMADQKVVEETGNAPSLNQQGNISGSDLAAVMNVDEYLLQSPTALDSTSLQAWADSTLLRAGMSQIKGKVEFQGSALACPGKIIELDRVGDRFNGNVYVSSVVHVLTDGNWVTEAEFGMPGKSFFEEYKEASSAASGLIPGTEGLQVGIIEKLDGDPDGENRIQVTCPMLGDDATALWARLSNFYGLSDYGSFFIPEVGTEVIIGFFNNDPRFPVILGSLYSSTNTPPYEITSDNYTKAIVTKNKLKIEMDDENKITNIETPGGNKITISDEAKSILLSDQNSNTAELNSDGISLYSPKDIKISSDSKITLEGSGGITLDSDSDITISGMNIDQEASASLTAKGSASAEFSASGNTTIKGALVMIN